MTERELQHHNQTVYDKLEVGDLIEFKRNKLYSHWAVYIGQGEVVHLSGEEDDGLQVDGKHMFTISGVSFNKACVRTDNFWDVVDNSKAVKNNKKDDKWTPYPKAKIVERALSKLGRIGYNIMYSNCEHFVSWCRYNIERSDQVDSYLTGLAAGVALAVSASLAAWLSGGSKDKDKEKSKEKEDY